MKYSDLIKLQSFLPVYDILEEKNPDAWKSFIPTNQFNDLLRQSLTAMTSTEVSKRKSIWVRGTFGTGKSHASAVVKHLLCDDFESIKTYIENIHEPALRQKLLSMRESGKRYFSVTLKGVEKAYDIPRFTLSLQRETQRAIRAILPDFNVKSDFMSAVDWITSHERIFSEDVLAKDEELQTYVSSMDEVIRRLEAYDTTIYMAVDKAVRENVGDVFQHTSISEWLVEVEQELEAQKIADGLIIFWDEFTSVMDTLKSDRINVLQNIAEKSQNYNVFLFLISHRVESQSHDTRSKDITKMSDRFAEIDYAMDTLSTYRIMRHSFVVPSEDKQTYDSLRSLAVLSWSGVFDFLCERDVQERRYIQDLFPLHPYTAYLCSTLSNHIGSSNRSVIRFMHDDINGFAAFIDDENNADQRLTLTADSLWDFFFDSFESDVANTTFTSLYKSYRDKVQLMGDDYMRVFKAILLLNVLALKFKGNIEKLTPDEKTLKLMFAGDRIAGKLSEILDYLNSSKIVVKNVFGQFKISASSYNLTEMNEAKIRFESSFKTAPDILTYNVQASDKITELFKVGESLRRRACFTYFACEETESLLRSKLNKFMSDKPNHLHIAFFLSIDEQTRDEKLNILKAFSTEYKNILIILAEETFSRDSYAKFIDALATADVAKLHHNKTEANEYEVTAREFVNKWAERVKQGSYTLFFDGTPYNEGIVDQVSDLINRKISGKIFTSGFEAVKAYSTGTMNTFFVDKNCPQTILRILEAQTRDQLIIHNGNQAPIKEIFSDDSGNSLITLTGELSEMAQNSNAWLVQVCNHVDKCIEDAKAKYSDKFSLSEIFVSFIKPPYGFYVSFANCAAFAYAIRKHKRDLFIPGISQPISDERLQDMLVELFKMWKDGRSESNNKMMLRFGSPEESKLTDLLIGLFDLAKVPGVNVREIKSLANAKWGIEEFCKKTAKYPLWTLLHMPNLSEDLSLAVKGIIELFSNENPTVERIKVIYRMLELNRMELNLLLTKPQNYEKGFVAFVDSLDDVQIEKAWWTEMMEAVDTLPSEIAFRKEDDVKNKILAFYIRKIKPTPAPAPQPVNGQSSAASVTQEPSAGDTATPSTQGASTGGATSTPSANAGGYAATPPSPIAVNDSPALYGRVSPECIASAKMKVKTQNMPNMMWQKVILDLLDEYPDAAKFVDKYLS